MCSLKETDKLIYCEEEKLFPSWFPTKPRTTREYSYKSNAVQECYWWPNTSWSLSNVLCCCPTRVHKKPVARTLRYSDTLQVGNLSVITEKWSNDLGGSVRWIVVTIKWAQGNGISSWVEQDHYYQQIFLSDWISLCSAKIFSNVKWYLFGYASVHLCTVNLFCLHCKKWFVILTIAFVTRIATVTWF